MATASNHPFYSYGRRIPGRDSSIRRRPFASRAFLFLSSSRFTTVPDSSLNPVRVSRTATVRKGHGKEFNHGSKQNCTKACSWDNHCVHDGQLSSMKNEKHGQKKPGVDHPIASVDDRGAYDVAHGNFFHENSQVAILNKNVPMMRVTCDLCRKTEFAPQKPLRP